MTPLRDAVRRGRTLRVRNATRGMVVADAVRAAVSFPERLRGLLGRPPLGPGEGLLILPCNAIHTLFMRYAIDALFLDGIGRVLHVERRLGPYRASRLVAGAEATLELPAGAADQTEAGDVLAVEEAEG